jgi:hypothetical protein
MQRSAWSRHALDPAHAKRLQAVLILEASEGTLDRATPTVEVTEPLALARDQRVRWDCSIL